MVTEMPQKVKAASLQYFLCNSPSFRSWGYNKKPNNQIVLPENIYFKYSRKKINKQCVRWYTLKGKKQGEGRGRVRGQGGGSLCNRMARKAPMRKETMSNSHVSYSSVEFSNHRKLLTKVGSLLQPFRNLGSLTQVISSLVLTPGSPEHGLLDEALSLQLLTHFLKVTIEVSITSWALLALLSVQPNSSCAFFFFFFGLVSLINGGVRN